MSRARSGPNAPRWRGQAPFHEDWYAKANLPAEDASVWVRYTLRAPEGGGAEASVWAIVEAAGEARAAKRTVSADELELGRDPFRVETPHGALRRDGCRGRVGAIGFDLSWEPTPYVFRPLPGWAYRLPDRVSKTVTPNPNLAVRGTVEVGGRELELAGAPGQQGHVWGRAHADEWAWVHDNAGPGPVVSVVAGRRSLAGVPTPLFAVALVRRRGRTLAFRNPLVNRVSLGDGRLELEAHGLGHRLRVQAEADRLRRLAYADPDGTPAYCHNTKRADAEVRLDERRLSGYRPVGSWTTSGTMALEVGRRDPIAGAEPLDLEEG